MVVAPLIFMVARLSIYIQIDNGIGIHIKLLDSNGLIVLFPTIVRDCGLEFFALEILLGLRGKRISQFQIPLIDVGVADHLHVQQFFRNQLVRIAVAVGIHHMLRNHLAVHLIENDHNPAGNPLLIKSALFADFVHWQYQTFVSIDEASQFFHLKCDGGQILLPSVVHVEELDFLHLRPVILALRVEHLAHIKFQALCGKALIA